MFARAAVCVSLRVFAVLENGRFCARGGGNSAYLCESEIGSCVNGAPRVRYCTSRTGLFYSDFASSGGFGLTYESLALSLGTFNEEFVFLSEFQR